MTTIVSGIIRVDEAERDRYLADCLEVVIARAPLTAVSTSIFLPTRSNLIGSTCTSSGCRSRRSKRSEDLAHRTNRRL